MQKLFNPQFIIIALFAALLIFVLATGDMK